MQVTRLQATATAPAGVGNIGVGFDLLGHSIAGLSDRATVRRIDAPRSARGRRSAGTVDVLDAIPFDTERNTAGRGVRALREGLALAVRLRDRTRQGHSDRRGPRRFGGLVRRRADRRECACSMRR